MPRLPVEKVVPGQTLDRPVANANGVLLVPAGTELTASIIARLASAGIESVTVKSDGADGGDVPSLEARLRDVEARFAGHEGDPLMMELKAAICRQIDPDGEVARA